MCVLLLKIWLSILATLGQEGGNVCFWQTCCPSLPYLQGWMILHGEQDEGAKSTTSTSEAPDAASVGMASLDLQGGAQAAAEVPAAPAQ
eukprot:scaffold130739_cov17-Tisochrysis_lutea.AAC.1